MSKSGAKGRLFSRPFRPWPVREAYSRRANHPFTRVVLIEADFDAKNPDFDLLVPYFEKEPYHYKDGLDYIGGVEYESKEGYWFMHKLSDILKALIKNGLILEDIEEYNLEMANNESTKVLDKFPLSYMVVGRKLYSNY